MITGIFINLVSAVILFFLGILFNSKITPLINRQINPLRAFFYSNSKSQLNQSVVVHGYVRSENDRYFIEQGDLQALMQMEYIVSELCSSDKIIIKDGIHKSNDFHNVQNLFSISGPKWNKYTENLIGLLGSPVTFKKTQKQILVRTSRMESPVIYSTKLNAENKIEVCYGFLIYSKLQVSSGNQINVLVACGRTTFSTNASALLLKHISKRVGVYKELKGRGLFTSSTKWGVLFKVSLDHKNKSKIFSGNEINFEIVQVFSEDDFLDSYTYEY